MAGQGRSRELWIGAAIVLIFGVAVARILARDPSPIRRLSVEAVETPSEPAAPGDVLTRELSWTPPDDVYLLGWHAWVSAPANRRYNAEMTASVGRTRIFFSAQSVTPPGVVARWPAHHLPEGTGFRVLKGERLVVRYRLESLDAEAFESGGATALLYFVPVQGN